MAKRVNRGDTDAMIALAFRIARSEGRARYLQPTYNGWALESNPARLVGLGYLTIATDGTVTRATLDGPVVVGQAS